MFDNWEVTAVIPKLAVDEVHIWRIRLEEEAASEAEYSQTLTRDEVERAARLRAGQVRIQFLAGRAWVRRLLASEIGSTPAAISIVTGEYGKPRLATDDAERLHFNVAHSRSTVLVALSRSGPLGIDVEYLDRATDVLAVSRHSLTECEITALMAIADVQERTSTFFKCWTRKEAVVKADGRGLSLPLNSFEVPVHFPCRMSPVDVAPESGTSDRYYLSDLAIAPSVAGAVAVSNRQAGLRLLTPVPGS